ncbi:type II toxin-antitoxin system prevent-host-death family antitoxin [Chelativorans sp.]|uniref:type II toxin-antitoxin system Phd/YefM family antitoxin n=1 Tax=Chelativorans sp. TaxID=2203393 RepID=UPI0028116B0D|nr:type II toxin-antitoxin system prevent-host-death family antitoxin [Chelativorans sp.]
MKTVSLKEAEANFSSLVGDAERGETICITRHGKTIARLTPEVDEEGRRRRGAEAVLRLQEWRKALPKTDVTAEEILKWRDEGRK